MIITAAALRASYGVVDELIAVGGRLEIRESAHDGCMVWLTLPTGQIVLGTGADQPTAIYELVQYMRREKMVVLVTLPPDMVDGSPEAWAPRPIG